LDEGDGLEQALRSAFCEAVTEYVNEGELPSTEYWAQWLANEVTGRALGFSPDVIESKSQELAAVIELAEQNPHLALRYGDACLRRF
jgi:hypothetical protein